MSYTCQPTATTTIWFASAITTSATQRNANGRMRRTGGRRRVRRPTIAAPQTAPAGPPPRSALGRGLRDEALARRSLRQRELPVRERPPVRVESRPIGAGGAERLALLDERVDDRANLRGRRGHGRSWFDVSPARPPAPARPLRRAPRARLPRAGVRPLRPARRPRGRSLPGPERNGLDVAGGRSRGALWRHEALDLGGGARRVRVVLEHEPVPDAAGAPPCDRARQACAARRAAQRVAVQARRPGLRAAKERRSALRGAGACRDRRGDSGPVRDPAGGDERR